MSVRGHRRQVLLFLAAILVPCLVLLALSVRMIWQESAFIANQRSEARLRFRNQARADLIARLEAIKSDEVRRAAPPYVHRDTVLVAPIVENRPVLPSESAASEQEFRDALGRGNFAALFLAAERHELTSAPKAEVAAEYAAALRAAANATQAAHARLAFAQVLAASGRREEAASQFRLLSAAPVHAAGRDGVPVQVRAAEGLVELGVGQEDAAAALESAAAHTLPADAWYVMAPLVVKLASNAGPRGQQLRVLETAIAGRIGEFRQAVSLQQDYQQLDLPSSRPVWQLYGSDPWLVSAGSSRRGSRFLIAVRAAAPLKAVESAFNRGGNHLRFVTSRGEMGDPVGDDLPGLRAAITLESGSTRVNTVLQWRFLYAAIVLTLGATMFVAYLLWRDLRRELRLADLRSQFVSSVSHELKTPLTAIRMFAETLQMGRSRDRQTENEYLDTIVTESERLSRLVDGVLLFSKIEQGKRVYRFRSLNLAEVIDAACRTMQHPLEQEGFRLRVDVDDSLAPVRADRDALEQALLNLLSNAVKYSGEARDIDLTLRGESGWAVIAVKDRGIGIAAGHRQRIFDKYYRAPTRENQLIPGTGLGLALVAHIVKAHGGRIEVESAPGKGSTFRMCFRLEEEDEHDSGGGR